MGLAQFVPAIIQLKSNNYILAFCTACLLLVSTAATFAPPVSDPGIAFRARLLKVFPKYIEWPESEKKGDFIVGFVGNTALADAFTTAMSGRTVGSQNVKVRKFASSKSIEKCHILYVSTDKSNELSACVSKVKKSNTLIITDKNGLISKSGINFVVLDSRVKFELNAKILGANNLKFNPDLKKIASKVIE